MAALGRGVGIAVVGERQTFPSLPFFFFNCLTYLPGVSTIWSGEREYIFFQPARLPSPPIGCGQAWALELGVLTDQAPDPRGELGGLLWVGQDRLQWLGFSHLQAAEASRWGEAAGAQRQRTSRGNSAHVDLLF